MINNKNSKRYILFIFLTISTGIIYKLPYIQDVFYVPLQESLNLSHTQIGNLLSVSGFFSVFGFLGSMYFIDRVSKRILIPCGLIGMGIVGIYLSTFPKYNILVFIWILFALFGDMLYWPVLVKNVKSIGSENEQGRLFGFFEAGRGLFDTIVVLLAVYIFSKFGSLKYVIIFYSIISIIMGVVIFIIIEDDKNIKNKNDNKFTIPTEVFKSKEVWLVAGNIFCSYSIYCGLTYMMPFLQSKYSVTAVLIGLYSIINQYGIKILAGPISGYLADKTFKSSSKYFRFGFLSIIIIMVFMILFIDKDININSYFVMIIIFSSFVNSMKALFFAPVEEIEIDKNIEGSSISFISFIGYSPLIFCYSLYGIILDSFEGIFGYKILFIIITIFAILGLIINKKLISTVKLKKVNIE